MRTLLALALCASLAHSLISRFPTGQTMPAPALPDRYAVLQSIPTAELLAIAAECMAEEGADSDDMHAALADVIAGAR